jgi:hypothetical protein
MVVYTLNGIVALACGFIGIIWYIEPGELDWLYLAQANQYVGLILFLVALTTVLVNVTYMVIRYVQGYPMRTQVPVRGGSSVTVSLQALRDTLARTLNDQPEVHSADVELEYERRKHRVTEVRVRGTIWDGPDILQTTLKMQTLLRSRFYEIVEPDEPPKFEVQLESVRFPEKERKGFRERIDKVLESFRGPQYPVGEE